MKHNIMNIGYLYRNIVKPILFKMRPEKAHELFLSLGKGLQKFSGTRRITKKLFFYENSAFLGQNICGIYFSNPVGLSAGFDKDGELYDILQDVGFGFMQIGSMTRKPYAGNPLPRLRRLPKSQGIIVNYGLKNKGVETIVKQLPPPKRSFPLSLSIAKTNCECNATDDEAIYDYEQSLRIVEKYNKGDMYTINISCPNTFGGEPFTTPQRLDKLLTQIDKLEITKPIFLKMPLDKKRKEFKALLDIILKHKVQGVIIGNLKKQRKGFLDPEEREKTKHITGGVSGKPTRDASNEKISKTYAYCKEKLVIIGVGGIFNAENAYEKIKRGASLVQLITGMIYQGPQVISEINKGLVQLLQKDGYSNIHEAIGSFHRDK